MKAEPLIDEVGEFRCVFLNRGWLLNPTRACVCLDSANCFPHILVWSSMPGNFNHSVHVTQSDFC